MATSSNADVVTADKPLSDPQNDRLGYAPFAKHLADSIRAMDASEGFVIALYGAWGSGKSTALNFVVHYLEQMPLSDQPVIVNFNPWWFSGHDDLIRRFFDQLQASLGKRQDVSQEVAKKVRDFAKAVSETPVPYSSLAKPLEVVAGWFAASPKDVPASKEKVAEVLRNEQKRILVVVDDVDRLTGEEIRQLFRVIKAVADLPNIIYLIAFDKDMVIKALTETQGIPGDAYLEKIVQVPFDLPIPDKTSLRGLLDEKLNLVVGDIPEESFDQNYWLNVYFDGVDHFIRTPRDINRLINTLSVTYSAVRGEVNPTDFIAVEALRVFSPREYDIIRRNAGSFAGLVSNLGATVENLRTFHDSWIQQVQDENQEPIKRLVMRLVPKLGQVWGNIIHAPEAESNWSRDLRVCSPNRFPVYFRLAVPEGEISNTEMMAILALASDANAFGTKLLELAQQKRPDGRTRLRALLERLQDYTRRDVAERHIPEIIQALFDVGDGLLPVEDDPRGLFESGNAMEASRITYQLLRRLDESTRFQVLKDAIENSESVSTIVREVALLEPEGGVYQPSTQDDVYLNDQHLQELKSLALVKIEAAAQRGVLLDVPDSAHVMYRWVDWAGQAEPWEWTQKFISDDKGLVLFLETFLHTIRSSGGSELVTRTTYRLDPQSLERFLEPAEIIDRVKSLVDAKWLTERQRLTMTRFVEGYEIRERGENPNFLHGNGIPSNDP